MEDKFIITMDKDVRECSIWKLEEQRTSEWKVSCKMRWEWLFVEYLLCVRHKISEFLFSILRVDDYIPILYIIHWALRKYNLSKFYIVPGPRFKSRGIKPKITTKLENTETSSSFYSQENETQETGDLFRVIQVLGWKRLLCKRR